MEDKKPVAAVALWVPWRVLALTVAAVPTIRVLSS